MDQENNSIIMKTVFNGKLKVQNVPHVSYPNGYGFDGEKEYIPTDVLYKLSQIFQYMLDNKISEMDFEKW